MTNPVVSIVIPTYNNQDTIGMCLESIENQSYNTIETILVDGGSTDYTREICGNYDITLIESDLGMSAARVKGAEVASGDYLFHVDSDMELTEGVVEECVNESDSFDALIIPETNIGGTYWARCTDIGKTISRRNETGNLRFLPRELYFDVGGHNPKLLGKEDEELHDLVKLQGASIGSIEHEIRHHIGNVRLVDILSQRWRYMRSMPAYEKYGRINNQTVRNNSEGPNWDILKDQFSSKPTQFIGYLVIELSTAFLGGVNRLL